MVFCWVGNKWLLEAVVIWICDVVWGCNELMMSWRYPISHLILCHQGSTCTGDTPSHTWYYVTGDWNVLEIPHLTPNTMSPGIHMYWRYPISHLMLCHQGSTCTGDTPSHTWYYVTGDWNVLEIPHLTPNTMSPGIHMYWRYPISHLILCHQGSTCTGDTPSHTWYYVTRDWHVLEIPHLTPDTMSPGIHMYWRYPISHLVLWHQGSTCTGDTPYHTWCYVSGDPHVLEIPHLTLDTMSPGIHMYWRYPISHQILCHWGSKCTGDTPSHTWYYVTGDPHVLEIPHLTPDTMSPGIDMYWRYPISLLILCHRGSTCTGDTPSYTWCYVTRDLHVLMIPHLTPDTMSPGIHMYCRYPISHLIHVYHVTGDPHVLEISHLTPDACRIKTGHSNLVSCFGLRMRALAKVFYRGKSRGKIPCQRPNPRAKTWHKIWMTGLNPNYDTIPIPSLQNS